MTTGSDLTLDGSSPDEAEAEAEAAAAAIFCFFSFFFTLAFFLRFNCCLSRPTKTAAAAATSPWW